MLPNKPRPLEKNKSVLAYSCLSLALGSVAYFFSLYVVGVSDQEAATIAIVIVTATFWISEALPLPIAALIPFVLFPATGILTHQKAASALGSHVILLLMGSFMFTKALEKCGAHEQIARLMIRFIGTRGKRLVFGFMVTSAVLSMWLSNTATTLMLLPIVIAVIDQTKDATLQKALLLGIAYASSVGGMGTPIGTPPNLIFSAMYTEYTGVEFGFMEWMKTGLVCVGLSIPIMALWLTRHVRSDSRVELGGAKGWDRAQLITLGIFLLTVIAWVTRTEPFGGWSNWLGLGYVGDGSVVLAAVLLMFLTPTSAHDRVLDWRTASTIPWGLLILFASGICIAYGFMESGLSDRIGQSLEGAAGLPLIVLIAVIVLGVSFLTELTSSTATATLVLPVLASVGIATGMSVELLMIPAALAASCSFMLPVSTAPNAIVMSTERLRTIDMAREGLALNILIALTLTLSCWITLR